MAFSLRPHGLHPHNDVNCPNPNWAPTFLTRFEIWREQETCSLHLPWKVCQAYFNAVLLHSLPKDGALEDCCKGLTIWKPQLLQGFLHNAFLLVHRRNPVGNPHVWMVCPTAYQLHLYVGRLQLFSLGLSQLLAPAASQMPGRISV